MDFDGPVGPRRNWYAVDHADGVGPDYTQTRKQVLEGYIDEEADYGPSDDEDKDLEWRHSKRSRPVIG
jgi:hypothetical protein